MELSHLFSTFFGIGDVEGHSSSDRFEDSSDEEASSCMHDDAEELDQNVDHLDSYPVHTDFQGHVSGLVSCSDIHIPSF